MTRAATRRSEQAASPQALSDQGKAQLAAFIASAKLSDLSWPDFRRFQTHVKNFYKSNGESLAWVSAGKPTDQARALIEVFQNAENKGLDPEDYDSAQWEKRLADLTQADAPTELGLIEFDLAVTISAMRYASDLRLGRANPRRASFSFDADNTKYDLADFLQSKIVRSPDLAGALAALEPSVPGYHRELAALQRYLKVMREDSGERLPVPRRAIRPGGHYAGLRHLADLLQILGDLPTTQQTALDSDVYRDALVKGVKHFQFRNGLDADGLLGARTVEALNVPLAHRVLQLELALERWRWLPHSLPDPPIVVNIPQFVLRAYDEQHHQVLSMKVVVGEAFKNETPALASRMRYVILRPAWDVPVQIALEEILPEAAVNPAVLAEKHYEVRDKNGDVLNRSAITPEILDRVRAGDYSLRQAPGPDNSLGLIKFEFPNPYGIYLHDTPATALYSRSRRDFSHGCIRVEDPIALAAWLLRDNRGWDKGRIVQEMKGEETVRIRLARRTPLLILYSTATVTEVGEVHFADDVYGDDKDLEKALADRQH